MPSALNSPWSSFRDDVSSVYLRIFLWSVLCAFFVSGAIGEAVAEPMSNGEQLVPGAIGVRTDGRGNTWNLEANGSIGRVGSTMVNTGLVLEVNGEKFQAYQPMMTPDGESIVLQGRPIDSLPGLQIQRKIQILKEKGGLRYVEMFFNGSTDPLAINVALVTNFSGNYQSFFTDRGRTEPALLGAEEGGILVLPGATQSTRAFLFSLAGSNSSLKPTLTSRNRYAITFQYALTLEPGASGVILHEVAQTIIPQSFERRRLLSLFSPFALNSSINELPKDLVPLVQNVEEQTEEDRLTSHPGIGFKALGANPVEQDLLLIGDETRLLGTVESESLELVGVFGTTGFQKEEIYAFKGEGGTGKVRTFFRNGEILVGDLSADELRLLPAGGGSIEIAPESLDRLLFAEQEAADTWQDGVSAILETHLGERIILTGGEEGAPLRFSTAWGSLKVSMGEIVWVGQSSRSIGSLEILLKNGSRCFGNFQGEKFSFSSERFGEVTLDANMIRSLFTPASEDRGRWDTSMAIGTTVYLRGSQAVVGEPSSSVVSIRTGGTAIDTDFSQIRSLSVEETSSQSALSSVRIERWDAGIVSGLAQQTTISFRIGEEVWRVPFRDIERIEPASPNLTSETLEEMKDLVLLLGSDSWEERERASRELDAFGYLAAPFLKKHLQITDDPEVKRRLERILANQN